MVSRTSSHFRNDFARLPAEVKRQAKAAYQLFKTNPNHPSLRVKKLPPHADIWSVRVGAQYRAIGHWENDVILWFFIGSHGDYDKLLERL
jgi:mRNA-degrading endonuclease RelE of RelBE toxin-antitoxin system